MNKMFKIGSIVAALAVSGMLVGCGSSTTKNSGEKPKVEEPKKPTTPVLVTGVCGAQEFTVPFGTKVEATNVTLKLKGKLVKVDSIKGMVDGNKAGTYDINVTSKQCTDSPVAVKVVVQPKKEVVPSTGDVEEAPMPGL